MADDERNELDERRGGGAQAEEQEPAEQSQSADEAAAEEAKQKVEELEDDPPEKLEDWPDDKAKYETFGGPEGQHSYEEGPEKNLGASGVRHHEDGSVSVDGEKVDNPEDYKGDPIPGGPTDPNSPDAQGEREKEQEEGGNDDQGGDGEGEG